MLAVYTAYQQSDDIAKAYTHALACCGRVCPAACRSNNGFALKVSWCREMATGNFKDMFSDLPPGTINIYGIRKHGTGIPYQPRCPGKIKRTTTYTNNLHTNFFQMMVEMISCVLDGSVMSPNRVAGWLKRWGSISFEHSSSVHGEPIGPAIKCFLNSDPDDIPELDPSNPNRFWARGNMHGTIAGIPSHWAKSIPIMSYLLYLPRVWGIFYSTPRALPKLSQISRRKMVVSPVLRSIIGDARSHSSVGYHTQLWSLAAYKMILPLWCTPYGKEYFWTFTYLLIKAALGNSLRDKDKLASDLCSTARNGGFRDWLRWYKTKEDAPKWVRGMLNELSISGPSSLVHFDSFTAYI